MSRSAPGRERPVAWEPNKKVLAAGPQRRRAMVSMAWTAERMMLASMGVGVAAVVKESISRWRAVLFLSKLLSALVESRGGG